MKPLVKRIVLGVGGVLLLFVLSVVGIMAKTFSGNVPMPEEWIAVGGTDVALIPDAYVAAYAVPTTSTSVALIDCGNDKEAKAINAFLQQQHKTVDAIFITHGHPDHLNGCKALPKAPIHALAAEAELMKGDVASKGPLPRVLGPSHLGVGIDQVVKDDQVVLVGNTAFHVYAVPGHTAGSAVYSARGVLFFGDTALGGAAGQVKSAPWVFSDDVALDIASLQALSRRVDPTTVRSFAYAHSGPQKADLGKLGLVE